LCSGVVTDATLEKLGDGGEGSSGSVSQCPACGALFSYRRESTFIYGGSEDNDILTKLDRAEAIAILLASDLDERSAEGLRRLGVPDGLAAIRRRLEEQLGGDSNQERFYAVRKLIRHAVKHHDEAALDRLCADTRPAVRQQAISELAERWQWRRALRALHDPAPSVQETAVLALEYGGAEGIPALAECLLKGSTEVRHLAATRLERLTLKKGIDVAPAFSALANALRPEECIRTRRAAARTFAKAARRGKSRSALREILARYVRDRGAEPDREVAKEIDDALNHSM
jgi:hypothetical protein